MYESLLFFFNDTATTEIYTLSLHDALPISRLAVAGDGGGECRPLRGGDPDGDHVLLCPGPASPGGNPGPVLPRAHRSEEHTSELQSRQYLVCRLLLEKKKKQHTLLHLTLLS